MLPSKAIMGKPAAEADGRRFHRLSHARIGVQPKLRVSSSGDAYEQEADRMERQVMAGTLPAFVARGGQGYEQGKEAEGAVVGTLPGIVADAVSTPGAQLDPETREFMESRFGFDFGRVRIHADRKAAESTLAVNALAYTIANDIVFGEGQYAPNTARGMRLLAHELAHTVQQRGNFVQRQEIPAELMTSVDLMALSDTDLQSRYDLISATLAQFDYSSYDTVLLEQEAGSIGIEFARRRALLAGRTFTPESIERMRQHFVGNATSAAPMSCIATLNTGVRLLVHNPAQPLGSEVQTTMGRLMTAGMAGQPQAIEFRNARGNITTGTTEPVSLDRSVWDTLIDMTGGDPGWSVFGLSLMDGYHSVTLTLDNNDPSRPRVYWSDQWSNRGGWQEFDRAGLDAEITRLTRSFRERFHTEHGTYPRTRVTLWRLRQPPPAQPQRP